MRFVTFCLLPTSLHAQAAPVAIQPKELGGGPVIDPTTETQVSGFQNQVNAAITACPSNGCTIDMRSYKTTVEFTSTTTFPQRANVILPYSWSLASGVSLVHSGGRLQGDSVFGSQGVKVNQSTDYTPYITTPGGIDSGGGNVGGEIDHIRLSGSTPSSRGVPIANTARVTCPSRSGYTDCTLYTAVSGSAFPGGASDGLAGRHMHALTTSPGYYEDGDWLILASTSTTVTTNSPGSAVDGAVDLDLSGSISHISASGNTVTLTVPNNFVAGMSVTISGMTTNTALNGVTVQLLSGPSPLTFAYSGAITQGAETGTLTATSGEVAVLDGGWGIAGTFENANIHDVLMYNTDLGILAARTGCTCYNHIHDNNLLTAHGALLLAQGFNSNTVSDNNVWANDQSTAGFNDGTGFGLWAVAGAVDAFIHNDSENTKYPFLLKALSYSLWLPTDVENDFTIGMGTAGNPSMVTLQNGCYWNWFPPGIAVIDQFPNGTNTYGSTWARQNPQNYGSMSLRPVSITNAGSNVSVLQGSGDSPIQYWIEGIDFNNQKTPPISLGSAANRALGPFTLSLTGVIQSAGVNTYAGTITGGAGNGLINTPFTITGFVNAGNNITCTPTATTTTKIVCKAASGVTETASASAAGVAKNRIGSPTIIGAKCVNILKGSTSALWQSCLYNFPGGSVYDDGSIPTGANVPNATDQTGLVSGATLGTSSNCASAASPAVCGSAASGSVVIAASATSVVVDTTAITPNSQMHLTEDESLGSRLGVTCNKQALTMLGYQRVTARQAATSFTISIDTRPTTNPMCVSYSIIN